MSAPRSETDLLQLRKLAEELAQARKERATTGHLLAAIASRPSPAADLLLERRLGTEVLLKAARATTDEEPDPIPRSMQRAREVARRMQAEQPGELHLLLALIHDRNTGAHRALAQCGVDVARLRASAMQLALGVVGPRRMASRTEGLGEGRPGASQVGRTTPSTKPPPRAGAGYAVPIIPEAPRAPTRVGPSVSQLVPHATAAPVATTPTPRSSPSAPPAAPKKRAPRSGSGSGRFALDPKQYPTLSALAKNLTQAAADGDLEPVVGRDEEIDQALDVLAKRHANNPCLVGPSGVGKTSVARGIALRVAAADRALTLDDRIILEIPIAELVAGTGVRGSLAERIAAIRAEVREAMGRIVLFFDEIHVLFAGDFADEVVGELKLALARGELPCIGATTAEEWRRVFEADPALARRFTVVEIEEPDAEDALRILLGIAPGLARHHGVDYADRALAAAVTWSVRYLPGRALPDKAVSILDLAGARAKRRSIREVVSDSVAEVVAELADIPVERLLETDNERMLALESILAERVVGHGPALSRIATILRRNAVGLRGRRPIGTFLLLGPTGVGKTETAKAIAEALFHSPDAMTRLDLGEFSEPHAVARLIGAPPGYIGHDAGGQLTEAVKKRPYQVILLDEIEKAHRDVLEAFLGVFDEGRLTDGRGKTVDFTNTVLVLTSNLGAVEASAKATRGIGFGRAEDDRAARACEAVVAAARAALPPELYNRIDEVIAFPPLERAEVAEIARRLLSGLAKNLETARGLRFEVEDEAIAALLDSGGYDPELGARPMKRTIARLVEAPIAELILRGELEPDDVVLVTADDGVVVIDSLKKRRRRANVA